MRNPNQAPRKGQKQLQIVWEYLLQNEATATMVAEATGVPQKNICRYKRELEKVGRLWQLRKGKCQLTGYAAWYLTTDANKQPKRSQLQFPLL